MSRVLRGRLCAALVWSLVCGRVVGRLEADDPGARRADDARASVGVVPLPRAHAHNDYEHERPLLDALSHGFTSVEADIFLVDGRLLVAHYLGQVRPERTLEALYLDPLLERVRANGGLVHPGGPEFTLLVDLKNTGEATYRVLHRVLTRYREMLTEVRDGKETRRAVRVILSGDRPRELLRRAKLRYAGYDGRLEDLAALSPESPEGGPGTGAAIGSPRGELEPAHFLPLVSDRWTSHFKYRGRGEIASEDLEKLRRIVRVAHGAGRRLRFWATPDTPAMWKILLDARVDHINTDDLPGLARFLRAEGDVHRPDPARSDAAPKGAAPRPDERGE